MRLPLESCPDQPFPNNTIPRCMINAQRSKACLPQVVNTAAYFHHSDERRRNSSAATIRRPHVREEIARVDHQFTGKFSVFGHWVSEQVSQTYGTTQWSGDNVPTVSNIFGNPSYSAVIHTTYVISPTLLNEASFNYNGNRINIIPQAWSRLPRALTSTGCSPGPTSTSASRRST